ncbi:hypothetical protein B0T14DRAFT_565492 [Immersiella caudata]|uniref:Uncharacterized protein n=1 Tax=Immersiella caudata TaxID=314043 RepID=A0AA40C400_9PEZI|nr:hypothetical protein B0T14DRAFT_565492 [Immersiella caudata]
MDILTDIDLCPLAKIGASPHAGGWVKTANKADALHASVGMMAGKEAVPTRRARRWQRLSTANSIPQNKRRRAWRPCPILTPIPTRLPPIHLNRRDGLVNFIRHFVVALAAICVLAGAIGYGISAYYVASELNTSTLGDNLCDREAAAASAERNFVIDIRFGGDFSFVGAKLIDLT